MALHGWLIVDKPVGPGSTQIVAAVKRALREGDYPKVKVGHGGTLDPLASDEAVRTDARQRQGL